MTTEMNGDLTPTRRILGLSGSVIAIVSGLIVAVAAIATVAIAVAPNLTPSTTNQASLTNLYIEHRVSLGMYLTDMPVTLSLRRDPAAKVQIDKLVQ
jgi:hypothetical protein